MMDQTALYKLSYGLYIISSKIGQRDVGCVVNTLQQVTSQPLRLSVAVNKENYTCKAIGESGLFSGCVITEQIDMDIVRRFGFSSSRDTDKFEGMPCEKDINGLYYINKGTAAVYSCKVVTQVDAGSHLIYIGDVVDCKTISNEPVMTYAYYHTVKNGKTPPKASSYVPEGQGQTKGWKCTVCGYVYEGEELPGDYVCPICKVPASKFIKI